jgi:hypothetical protein
MMTKEERKREGYYLGVMTGIIYDEHYLPNCIGEPITSNGFFLTPEFFEVLKTLSKTLIKKIQARADKKADEMFLNKNNDLT